MDGSINGLNSSFSVSFGLERSETANESQDAGASKQPDVMSQATIASQAQAAAMQMHINDMKRFEHTGGHLQYSDEHFMKMLNRAFKALDGRNTNVQFLLHDKTNQFVIKVMDRDTGELIREIPPEKSLDFLAKVQEMLGLIVDVRR